MYAYIKGILAEKNNDGIVVEAGGIGYQLTCPLSTLSPLAKTGEEVKVHTYLHIREDIMQLYGFLTKAERDMFIRVIGVSGIGPKVGISILSSLSVADFAIALVTDDLKALSAVPGIGKKTAQRLILELKEKIDTTETIASPGGAQILQMAKTAQQEAFSALVALGIRQSEASRALEAFRDEDASAEELIVKALRTFDKR